jgi:hypothetical protein
MGFVCESMEYSLGGFLGPSEASLLVFGVIEMLFALPFALLFALLFALPVDLRNLIN